MLMSANPRRGRGFSLIELVVVVAIIGILGAIAYPTYQDYVRKSRRGVARGDLMELSQLLERNFTEASSYAVDSAGNAINTAWLPFNTSPQNGANTFYNITVAVVSGVYTLTATPAGSQVSDACGTLNLLADGSKTPANCW